ncbi:MAG: glycosyltransferase, partial [Chloroflexaceae bacterium]
RLGYLGQIVPHKGVHLLVQAVRQLPLHGRPIQLRIFGNPEQNPSYTRRLQTLMGADPRMTLAGPFSSEQLPTVLSELDLTVVPSIWYENSPLTIREAHATGRPVITSRLGGMAELVRDEIDGLHFAPGDAGDLARQIQRLRNEPGLLERLRAGVRRPPSIDDEMAELIEAYRLVIDQRRATRPVEVA